MWINHYAKRYDTIRAETAGGDAFVQISKWPRRTAGGGGGGTGATALLSTAIFHCCFSFEMRCHFNLTGCEDIKIQNKPFI